MNAERSLDVYERTAGLFPAGLGRWTAGTALGLFGAAALTFASRRFAARWRIR